MVKFMKSAILYKDSNGHTKIRVGKRHHEIIKQIHDEGNTKSYFKYHVDGFILSSRYGSMFVDREEATELAESMNIPMIGCVLTSEDLW